jgi:protein ImuB
MGKQKNEQLGTSDVTRVAVIACTDWQAVAAQCELYSRKQWFDAVAVLHAQRVVARTAYAAKQGVEIGMRRREAQATCSDLHIATNNPERDRLMFESVVRAVCELVPLVEVSTPGVILLATRGPSRYVGGDDALAQRLHGITRDALLLLADGRPISFGVGIADGRLTALVAAHAANGRYAVVDPGESARCLAQLPVSVLADFAEIDRDVVSLLHRLGLSCIGDLAAMKPSDLVGRFGPTGFEIHRLARGCDRHPPITIAPPPERASTHRFELAVEDVNVVVATARQVADELVAYLSEQGVSCVRLHICMQTDHGEQSDRLWYQPEGLTAAAMAERVRWQMEAWIATRGLTSGVVLLRYSPVGLRAREGRQLGLWGGTTETDEWAARAVERLTAMLGSDSVRVPEWRGGRDVSEVFALTPAAVVDMERRAESVVSKETVWSGALPTPSPSIVYNEPLAAVVNDADGCVVSVSGRHELSASPAHVAIGQHLYNVVSWAGPWPVEERWWDPLRQRRAVRMQLVMVRDGDQTHVTMHAVLMVLEHGEWWMTARYG